MNFDEFQISALENLYRIVSTVDQKHTAAELRCLIVSNSLQGLADALLKAEAAGRDIDCKRTALGLLGVAEWLRGDLLTLQEEQENERRG